MGRPLVSLSKNFPPGMDVGGPVNPLTPLLPPLGCTICETSTSDLVSFQQNETTFNKRNVKMDAEDLSTLSPMVCITGYYKLCAQVCERFEASFFFSQIQIKLWGQFQDSCSSFTIDPLQGQVTASSTQWRSCNSGRKPRSSD